MHCLIALGGAATQAGRAVARLRQLKSSPTLAHIPFRETLT